MIKSPLLESIAAYVDGTWVQAASGAKFEVTNPADNSLLCTVPKLSGQETIGSIEAAVRCASNGDHDRTAISMVEPPSGSRRGEQT